jgi:hypothetical protein
MLDIKPALGAQALAALKNNVMYLALCSMHQLRGVPCNWQHRMLFRGLEK